MEIPKKIVWLASYPKSGNTWFRAFLSALLGDGDVDINDMKTDGIFSSRQIFDLCTDLDSTYLPDEEVKLLQPEVFNYLATITDKERLFIKVHDAYTLNQSDKPIIPVESTICALYFIRNPLDVACSFANHLSGTTDEAIAVMNNPNGMLARQKENLNVNNQFRQLLLSWSEHAESWTLQTNFPVLLIRYEDMLADTRTVFTQAARFIGISADAGQIEQAISASKFSRLKQIENDKGFKESRYGRTFFRQGESGNWKNELHSQQVDIIISNHTKLMQLHNYFIDI
ncbi:MAG: sulfotransferase domain-containing protein [Mariniphaga sp.]